MALEHLNEEDAVCGDSFATWHLLKLISIYSGDDFWPKNILNLPAEIEIREKGLEVETLLINQKLRPSFKGKVFVIPLMPLNFK